MLSVLKDKIDQSRSISFADFMHCALYNEKYGYYMSSNPLGARGDFITAPEISHLFNKSIAIWLILTWQKLGFPQNLVLADLGPGSGRMMRDVLDILQSVNCELFDSIRCVYMVEISPKLKKAQKIILAEYECVTWVDSINQCGGNDEMPIIYIANEFFDALPVRQFIYTESGWCENRVTFKNYKLSFIQESSNFTYEHNICEHNDIGSVVEINELAQQIVQVMKDRVAISGGAALIIDYGYENKPYKSTIQAMRAHAHHLDVLADVGNADITAYVDFAALGLPTVTQGDFLNVIGIHNHARYIKGKVSNEEYINVVSALDRLTSIWKMGYIFKVAEFYSS